MLGALDDSRGPLLQQIERLRYVLHQLQESQSFHQQHNDYIFNTSSNTLSVTFDISDIDHQHDKAKFY